MVVPSAANMKFKFPEFVQVDDTTIEFAVEEASVAVGQGDWINDANLTLALMYYAAHILMVSISRAESATGQMIKSESIGGEIAVTYESIQQPSDKNPDDLTTTPYGVRYLRLLKQNMPAVIVV